MSRRLIRKRAEVRLRRLTLVQLTDGSLAVAADGPAGAALLIRLGGLL